MAEKTLKNKGMTCKHCEETVKKDLYSEEGVAHVDVSLEEGTAKVRMDKDIPFSILQSAVEEWAIRW